MREAMARAEVGDDVFGDDPTVRLLEERGADVLGKESALFLPSGTMANQAALRTLGRPGFEVLLHEAAHVYRFEQGALAALHGMQAVPLPGPCGRIPVALLEANVRRDDPHFPRTGIVTVENTHNFAGGTVLDRPYMEEVAEFARRHRLGFHLDGARLWNAAVALGTTPAELAAPADTVTLCLSKGLGAPAGTLLAGSAAFILEARRARKLLGGGMRQAGILAAAGILALEEGPARLVEDHRRARALAAGLAGLDGVGVVEPETNIVVAEVAGRDEAALVAAMASGGVLAVPFGKGRVRLVTHRDVDDADVQRAVDALISALQRIEAEEDR